MKKVKPTHGGSRKGAGRKRKEPTVVIRIPKRILAAVNKLKVTQGEPTMKPQSETKHSE